MLTFADLHHIHHTQVGYCEFCGDGPTCCVCGRDERSTLPAVPVWEPGSTVSDGFFSYYVVADTSAADGQVSLRMRYTNLTIRAAKTGLRLN